MPLQKPDIIDVLQDLNRELKSNPMLEFVTIMTIINNKIKRERKQLREQNLVSQDKIDKLLSLYSNIKSYIADNDSIIKSISGSSSDTINKPCNISKLDDLENKINYVSTNRDTITVSEFDEIYNCMETTYQLLKEAVEKLNSIITSTSVPAGPAAPAPAPVVAAPVPVVAAAAPAPVVVLPAPVVVPIVTPDFNSMDEIIAFYEANKELGIDKNKINKYIENIAAKEYNNVKKELIKILDYANKTISKDDINNITIADIKNYKKTHNEIAIIILLLINLLSYRVDKNVNYKDTDNINKYLQGSDLRNFYDIIVDITSIRDILEKKIEGYKLIDTGYNIKGGFHNDRDIYYEKYMKYKSKYLKLKSELGV